jgi:hypothetical protein
MERLPDYLRRVWDVGRKSIRPALPALTFLYFYRVGLEAYLAVSDRTSALEGGTVDFLPGLAMAATFLPLVLLVYTPMLPLQDGILQDRPITFLAAVRRTLECAWNLTLSGIVQVLMLVVPFFVICIGAAIVLPLGTGSRLGTLGSAIGLTGEIDSAKLLVVALAAIVGFIAMIVVLLLLIFALQALVLDGEGPIRSIRTSIRLVLSHLGYVTGRILAFGLLSLLALIVLTLPTSILEQVADVSGASILPFKIATIVWSSLAAVLFFPFWSASVTVLYRSLVPATGASSPAPVALEEEYRPARATTAPFE